MEKVSQHITKDNLGYIEAQIDRINSSLALHQQQLNKLEELSFSINRNSKKIAELQRKFKLIQTYETENFRNNQRLFNSHAKLDIVEKKVSMLEDTQIKLIGGRPLQSEVDSHQLLQKMEIRFQHIEQQLQKSKQKSQSLVKFRRDMPQKLPNTQSTHDISIDHGTFKNQIKKIEKRLQETLAQKFASFEKKYNQILQQKKEDEESMNLGVFSQTRFNRQTRVKKRADLTQQKKHHQRTKPLQQLKHHFDSYYNEDIQKVSRVKTQRKTLESRQSFRPKLKQKNKKQKSKSKSLSEERSTKHLKSNQRSKYKNEVKLSSVSQYLRIHQKGR